MCSKEIKTLMLTEIENHKNVLFNLGAIYGKNQKSDIWKNIHGMANSFGAFNDKNWKYIRDGFWPNIRRCTLTKIENAKKNHIHDLRRINLTDIDHKVLSILSQNGLNTHEVKTENKFCPISYTSEPSSPEFSPDSEISEIRRQNDTIPEEPPRKHFKSDKMTKLREEKLQLEIDTLKKCNLKYDMEIRKLSLENEILALKLSKLQTQMGLPAREETRSLLEYLNS